MAPLPTKEEEAGVEEEAATLHEKFNKCLKEKEEADKVKVAEEVVKLKNRSTEDRAMSKISEDSDERAAPIKKRLRLCFDREESR